MTRSLLDTNTNIRPSQVFSTRRQGHLLGLNTISTTNEEGERSVDNFWLGFNIALYLGWRDFNERRGDILPHLPDLLRGCDFYTSLELRDTQSNPNYAIDQLLDATISLPLNTTQQFPFAIAGCSFSIVSLPISFLASGLALPMISATSTSSELDTADLFARTVPSNAPDARAVMTYMQSLGVVRMASVFVNEAYGIQYSKALKFEAKRLGIELLFFPIELVSLGENPTVPLEPSFQALKQSGVKYVFSPLIQDHWKKIFRAAYKEGVLGHPEYFWLTGDMSYLVQNSNFDQETERDLAKAVHGIGSIILSLESPFQEAFDRSFQEFLNNKQLQQDFLSLTAEAEAFQNVSFDNVSPPYMYHHLTYDSVIALGLAACNTPGLFTSQDFHRQLVNTSFDGVSGPVAFDEFTGTRNALTTRYQIYNLLISEDSSANNTLHINAIPSAIVVGDDTTIQVPFVYNDNTTNRPPDLPPLQGHNYHLVPKGALIFGIFLSGLVMTLSIAFMIWTVVHRSKFIVHAAQPVFLVQLCFGCFIMASAIIPLGMQGEQSTDALNAACMSIPWLLFLGYCFSVSAIVSKSWKLAKVVGGAQGLRRVKVSSWDVVAPTFAMLLVNVFALVGWTNVSPLQYMRTPVDTNQDEFGRSLESYGRCRTTNNWAFMFASVAGAANLWGFLLAAYHCYNVRNVSSYFSETRPLAYSMASLVETALLGAPILLVIKDSNPTAFFTVSSALICICCLAFLLPIFGFKVGRTGSNYKEAKEDGDRIKRNNERVEAISKGSAASTEMDNRRGTMNIVRASVAQTDASTLSLGHVQAVIGAASKRVNWRTNFNDGSTSTMGG